MNFPELIHSWINWWIALQKYSFITQKIAKQKKILYNMLSNMKDRDVG